MHVLTDHDFQQVVVWRDRIVENIDSALSCYRWMDEGGLQSGEHALTALAKYVENTTESIKQLDNLTKGKLFAQLVEIPERSTEEGAMTWRNMIGMRDRLSHKFYETDQDLLVNVVKEDFPKLAILFRTLLIGQWTTRDGRFVFSSDTADIPRPTEASHPVSGPGPGRSSIVALYHSSHGWTLIRLFGTPEGSFHTVLLSQESRAHGRLRMFGDVSGDESQMVLLAEL